VIQGRLEQAGFCCHSAELLKFQEMALAGNLSPELRRTMADLQRNEEQARGRLW
jgi:hypothetical protein